MSWRRVASCDVCGTLRTNANHWWIAMPVDTGITLLPWDDTIAGVSTAIHLCGEDCLHKYLSNFIGQHKEVA